MATSKKVSILAAIKAKGFEVSVAKTTLWAEESVVAEGVDLFDLYLSAQYAGSSYVIIREEDESILIPMFKGEIDNDDYETINDKGLVSAKDVQFSIDIKEMKAIRDDKDLDIKAGDTCLRAFVS